MNEEQIGPPHPQFEGIKPRAFSEEEETERVKAKQAALKEILESYRVETDTTKLNDKLGELSTEFKEGNLNPFNGRGEEIVAEQKVIKSRLSELES